MEKSGSARASRDYKVTIPCLSPHSPCLHLFSVISVASVVKAVHCFRASRACGLRVWPAPLQSRVAHPARCVNRPYGKKTPPQKNPKKSLTGHSVAARLCHIKNSVEVEIGQQGGEAGAMRSRKEGPVRTQAAWLASSPCLPGPGRRRRKWLTRKCA